MELSTNSFNSPDALSSMSTIINDHCDVTTESQTPSLGILPQASSTFASPMNADLSGNYTTSSWNGSLTTPWNSKISNFYDDKLRPSIGIVIGTVGLPTIVLLWAVTLTPKYRKFSYSLYLTFMCAYDFLWILNETMDSIFLLLNHTYVRSYLVWSIPCRIYEHLYFVTTNVSIWLNVVVAVDRYIVIAFPFSKDRWCNRRVSWIVTGGLLFIVHSVGILYIVYGKVSTFSFGDYCNGETILIDLDVYLTYLGGLVAIVLIFIFTTMSVINLYRSKQLRLKMMSVNSPSNNTNTNINNYNNNKNNNNSNNNSAHNTATRKISRATIALISIGMAAFLTQIPFIANEMLRLYARNNDKDLNEALWSGDAIWGYDTAVKIFEELSYIISIQNFFVLFVLNAHFREDLFNMLRCHRISRKGQGPIVPIHHDNGRNRKI